MRAIVTLRPTLLLASAFAPEARPFRESDLSACVFEVRIEEVGVGLVTSAVRTTRLLLEHRPSALLFAGTCGAYPGAPYAIGDVIAATHGVLADPSAISRCAHVPAILGARSLDLGGALTDALLAAGAKPAIVATTLSVTTAPELASKLAAATHASVEHLEAQSVAAACAELGVPCAIVLGVANAVGASSHAEWRANHARVSAIVGALVLSALRSGR